jgi:hypothetical protein
VIITAPEPFSYTFTDKAVILVQQTIIFWQKLRKNDNLLLYKCDLISKFVWQTVTQFNQVKWEIFTFTHYDAQM